MTVKELRDALVGVPDTSTVTLVGHPGHRCVYYRIVSIQAYGPRGGDVLDVQIAEEQPRPHEECV